MVRQAIILKDIVMSDRILTEGLL